MKVGKIFIIMLAAAGLFLWGCKCMERQKKAPPVQPAKAEPAKPCAAPAIAKTMQSYPGGTAMGNAIQLEKMAPTEIRANEPFEYKIKVTNLTANELSNVTVTDRVPKSLQFKTSVPQISKIEEGSLHWMLGTLDPKASKMITITALTQDKGTITSCTEVSYDSATCAKINIVEPKLELAKFAPPESLTCDRIPLRYVVTNTGTGFACDIEIKDTLQEGLMTAEGKNMVVFSLESLEPGKTKEFEIMIDAAKSGTYASKAIATSKTSGTAESNITQTRVSQPVLAINEICPANQYIGRSLTYEITVANNGDGIAKNTVVEAMLPEGTKFNNATEGGNFSHLSPGKVTWNIGTLEPRSSKRVSMTLTSDQYGTLTSSAMAKAYCAETVSTKCQTSLSGIPAILLEVIDTKDPIEVGESGTYVITVTNQGSAPGTNIMVSCILEDDMQYISSSGDTIGSAVGNKITFAALPTLAPKAQAKWVVHFKALAAGDSRFRVIMNSDQLGRSVEESEATRLY